MNVKFFKNMFCFFCIFLCQEIVRSQVNSISGNLIDSSGIPLAFINALLYDSTGNYTGAGALSETNGYFTIKNILDGSYTIKLSALGFKEKTIENIIISASNLKIELGEVIMFESSYQLESVDLIANKSILERKIDRTVLNVSNIISASGGNVIDVLEQTPGISIDRENLTISVLGKNGVNLMINGRMNYLPSDAIGPFIAGINADNIDKIELITTPPANFDAQGNAGFINLILKKGLDDGFNLNGNLSYGNGRGQNGLGNLNYNLVNDGFKINTNYSINLSERNVMLSIYRKFNSLQNNNESRVIRNRNSSVSVNNFNFSLDYALNNKINFGTNIALFQRFFWVDSFSENIFNDQIRNPDLTNRNGYDRRQSIQLNSYLNLKYEKLDVILNSEFLKYNFRQPAIYENSLNYGFQIPKNQIIDTRKETPSDVFFTSVDFKSKLKDKIILDYGFKIIGSRFENDQKVIKDNVEDLKFSGISKLDETVMSSYFSFESNLSDVLDLKTGLRYEHTDSNVSNLVSALVDRNYGNFFPNIFLSLKINDVNSINVNFTKRINRPSFENLAPFFIYIDENSAITGDPTLQPSISNNYQAEYRFKSIFFQLSYNITDDFIAKFQPTYNETENLQLMKPLNIDNRNLFNAQLSVPLNFNSWWSLRPDFIYNYEEIADNTDQDYFSMSQNNYRITVTQQFKLNQKSQIEIFSYYVGKGMQGRRIINQTGSLNIAFKTNAIKNWTITLNARNIFDSMGNIWSTKTENLFYRADFNWAFTGVNLSAAFNFGKSDLKALKTKKSQILDRF